MENKSLMLENPLGEILVCQEAEIKSLELNGALEHLVSIQRDILVILEAFADSIIDEYEVDKSIS